MTKILLAEDERQVRDSFADILVIAGYDVIEAEDGGAAFELACREHPDIILLDVMMPVMHGFEVLEKLRKTSTTADIPVIFLTALSAAEGGPDAMILAANHYIPKPCDPETLELTIKDVLAEGKTVADEEGDDSEDDDSMVSTPINPRSRRVIQFGDKLASLTLKLGGGLSRGSLTLIEGANAAGKSVLCQHLTYGALTEDYDVAYFTSEHTVESLTAQMNSIGLHVPKYLHADKLCIFPLQDSTPDEHYVDLLAPLGQDIKLLSTKYEFIVVDAITNFVRSAQDQSILDFFSLLKYLGSKEATVVLVAHPYAFDANMLIRLSDLCDTHLRLRTGKLRDNVVCSLEVVKANNVELDKDNLVSFRVEASLGMQIIPYSQAKV